MFDEESCSSSSQFPNQSASNSYNIEPFPSENFKLHIDSNLIKSNSSALPDELKDLGVCAYDENDFEKGVLFQVDLQIAEYELNKAKHNLKDSKQSASLPEENSRDEEPKKKRKNSHNYSAKEETYLEKKLVWNQLLRATIVIFIMKKMDQRTIQIQAQTLI